MSKQLHRIYAIGECSKNSQSIRVSGETYILIRTLAKNLNMNMIDIVNEAVKMYDGNNKQRINSNE